MSFKKTKERKKNKTQFKERVWKKITKEEIKKIRKKYNIKKQ